MAAATRPDATGSPWDVEDTELLLAIRKHLGFTGPGDAPSVPTSDEEVEALLKEFADEEQRDEASALLEQLKKHAASKFAPPPENEG